MSASQSHRMTPEERRAWSGLALAEPAAAPVSKEKKAKEPSQPAKNERVVAAAVSGDARALKEALSAGGSPNARERVKPRRSAIELALDHRNDEGALMLLEAGGLEAPHESSAGHRRVASLAFNEAVASGSFEEAQFERDIKTQTLDSFQRKAGSWALMERARDLLDPSASLEEMAAWNAQNGRWHITLEAFESGVSLALAWCEFGARHKNKGWDTRARADKEAVIEAFKTPKAVDQMEPQVCEWLFRAGAYWGDAGLLRAMLNAGLRPNAEWTVAMDRDWEYHRSGNLDPSEKEVSLLCFSAASESPEAFELLKKCAPAVEAARKRVEAPWCLRHIQISRLSELSALGCRIDGVGPNGGNLLHIWAQDYQPRAGWATMGRDFPAMFAHTDKAGKTGAERMREGLRDQKDKDAFSASLSRIESREIRREIPREKAKASAPKRSRL